MNIKINTNISSEYKETTITINAPKLSDEIQDFIKYISDIQYQIKLLLVIIMKYIL